MIGKPVPKEEFRKLFFEEKEKEEFVRAIHKELRDLKPGECLLYETEEGKESTLKLCLSLYLVKELEIIERPGKVYVHKK